VFIYFEGYYLMVLTGAGKGITAVRCMRREDLGGHVVHITTMDWQTDAQVRPFVFGC
jgi:hypothetical protein